MAKPIEVSRSDGGLQFDLRAPPIDGMALLLQATEQGSHAAAADPEHPRQPSALAASASSSPTGVVVGCSKGRASVAAGLPSDILLDILSRLPVKRRFQFKCVSKAWFGLVAESLRTAPPTLHGLFYFKDNAKGSCFFNLLGRSVPPMDPSFSFLKNLPEIEQLTLMDSCNGLVLFWHRRCSGSGSDICHTTLGYIVCNPATKEWVAVPRYQCDGVDGYDVEKRMVIITRLIFDPAASSRFELVQFLFHPRHGAVFQVRTYSSESGAWSRRATECWSSDELLEALYGYTVVNGMIHLCVQCRSDDDGYYSYQQNIHRNMMIAVVDGRGEKRKSIHWPAEERGTLVFLGQSQGLLHCVGVRRDQDRDIKELSIWVLKDYGTEEWILKDTVDSMQLFGEMDCSLDVATIAIHPDCSLAFFFHYSKRKMVSYDMGSREVSALGTLEGAHIPMTPYVPYFGESSALARKH